MKIDEVVMNLITSIPDIIHKVRYWGWKGVWGSVVRMFREYRDRRFFLRNARHYPQTPIHGITVIASLTSRGSLSKVMRDFVLSLRDAGVPYQTWNMDLHGEIPAEDVEAVLTPKADFRLLRYTHIITMIRNPLPKELGMTSSTIFFWEFDSGMDRAYPEFYECSSVIGMSDFNVDYFQRELPVGRCVHKILYPFRFENVQDFNVADVRGKYGLGMSDFVVFLNFDFGSSYNRKNPEGAMRAFAKAFSGVPVAKLVFKTMRAHLFPELVGRLKSLAEELGIGKRFLSIDDYMPRRDLYGLTAACDVYLSLHRGEGFGLGVAEAMSLGKAVIVTNYSATTEFCNRDNSMLVPSEMSVIPSFMIDHAYYVGVRRWAEPDVGVAASMLRELYENPMLRHDLGMRAKESIATYFSIDRFRRSVEEFIRS